MLASRSIPTLLAFFLLLISFALTGPVYAEPADPKLNNDRCLRCHGKEGFSRKGADGEERDLHVTTQKFEHSVHGKQDCVGCHQDITKAPHRKNI